MTNLLRNPHRLLAPAFLALTLAPLQAHAAWIGLADGNYTVNLSCDFSTVITCPGSVQGSLSIAGGSATQMSVQINGDSFSGDPTDTLFSNSLVDYESVTLSVLPNYRFVSLRLITAGQIGSYGVGDLWWVYCDNTDATTCAPNTTGTWSARVVSAVPEPTSAALVLLALAGGAAASGRKARPAP